MRIESINCATITHIDYEGKKIATGIFKIPIDTSVLVRKQNLEGDQQADLKNHGGLDKAVYAFSANHFSY